MAEPRRVWLRAALVIACVVVGLVEVRSELEAVRSHRRLRIRAAAETRARVEAALPSLMPFLDGGSIASWNDAFEVCQRTALASEGEVLEAETGRSLFSRPTAIPVATPPEQARQALRSGTTTAFVVQTGPELRALTYVPFDCGGRTCVLRLATPVPDVAEDLRDRQQLFIAHLLALAVLLLATGVTLLPDRRPRGESPPRSLDVYEQAMGRLRDQGEARSRAHEAERRRMEDEIKDKGAMARAGELTAGIVHEVRNGLGTIVGYARLLEGGPGAAEGKHIREECETLETVVRRFMDFVKRETLQRDTFDLVRTLTRVAARESRGREGGELVLERLPATLRLVGDEELLERAFENLVRNAREAAGPRGTVWLEASEDGGGVTVKVLDDGPGFPPERRQELRPFFTTKPGGLGLGLALAFKIVHLHGGELRLEDRVPKGLEVRVSLPPPGEP